MSEVRVFSWGELQDRLYEGSWREPLGRFRSSVAYRGVFDASTDLTTSLARLGGPFEQTEAHILRAFRKYARGSLAAGDSVGDSVWNWLALAQHHGLPTRLLDWTYSPYVALHFCTADISRFDRDGVVWCFDYVKAHGLLPETLRRTSDEEGADVFTAEMLDRTARALPKLDELGGASPFVLFLEPPSFDERIVNQFALFSLMSSPKTHLHEWANGHADLCRRLVIPAALKWEVRDKLDQANITERVLLPGLDGLCGWLQRYYSPRI